MLLVVSLWVVVSVGEDFLNLVLEGLSGLLVGKLVLSDDLLELVSGLGELTGDLESGWKNVVEVDDLNECLNVGSSLDLLLAHSLSNLHWVEQLEHGLQTP